MPKSRWKSFGGLEANQEYLVLASSIPTKKITSAWSMFQGSRIVRKQLATTKGVVGYSLLARPFRNEYATLSIWTDENALSAFATEQPHCEMMRKLSPEMGLTRFERWVINGSEGPPSWADALEWLG